MVTILVLAHNEKENAIKAVESIRSYEGINELSVILVDNASTDGLGDWARLQEDISYAYMEKGIEAWGSVINQVIDGFEIDSDILIMQSRYILLPKSLERMLECLHSEDKIALVGPVTSAAKEYQQQTDEAVNTIEEGVEYGVKHFADPDERALGVESGAFMIKTCAIKENGIRFEDRIFSLYALIKDLAVQIVFKGLKSYISRSSILYEYPSEFGESIDTLQYMDADNRILEEKWGTHYFNMTGNAHLMGQIESNGKSEITVLEVGCDCGATLLAIKNKLPLARIYGCDISEPAVRIAECITDGAFVANIEEEKMPVEKESLDYIIFGDVLEHLHNPKRTLEYVRTLLKSDGKIVASIPNLMNISVMKQLLKGNFTYTETGLMDKTHIHFFTFNEIVKIFSETGYSIEGIMPLNSIITDEDNRIIEGLLKLEPSAKRYMYETFQYITVAKKA